MHQISFLFLLKVYILQPICPSKKKKQFDITITVMFINIIYKLLTSTADFTSLQFNFLTYNTYAQNSCRLLNDFPTVQSQFCIWDWVLQTDQYSETRPLSILLSSQHLSMEANSSSLNRLRSQITYCPKGCFNGLFVSIGGKMNCLFSIYYWKCLVIVATALSTALEAFYWPYVTTFAGGLVW